MSWIATAIGVSVVAGGYSAYSSYQQGAAQNKYNQALGEQAEIDGEQTLAVAQKQSNLVQDQQEEAGKQLATNYSKLNATQVADEAANGTAGSVTAQDIAGDTFNKQTQDAIAMKYNADAKSWSIMTQGQEAAFTGQQQQQQYQAAGKNAQVAGEVAATGTILNTASSVASIGFRAGLKVPSSTPASLEGVQG